MNLYGKETARRTFEKYGGASSQLAGIQKFVYTDGPESGVDCYHVRTGGGLCYQILPSRGMDIHLADFLGTNTAWQSPAGAPNPAHYDARTTEFLRTAAGGLLMSCGPLQVGWRGPKESSGEGAHGRWHHLAARNLSAAGEWRDGQLTLTISGEVRQSRLFGENLSIHRTIESPAGEAKITVTDRIRNNHFTPQPIMILYHFNFGFPLLSSESVLDFPSQEIKPRDAAAAAGDPHQIESPEDQYPEQVFFHSQLKQDSTGDRPMAVVQLMQPKFPIGPSGYTQPVSVILSWDPRTLPQFVQWKMCGSGFYALGIEPSNCLVNGMDWEREAGTLQHLEPGEEIETFLAIEFCHKTI